VTSPEGDVLYSKSDDAKGKFALTATEDGIHQMCFHNRGAFCKRVESRRRCLTGRCCAGPQPRNIVFSFKHGVDAKDYSGVAKKDHLEPLEVGWS